MARKIRSLEDFRKVLNNEADQLVKEDLDVIKNYLTVAFIKKHTSFSDLETFLISGGFSAKSQSEFNSIPVDAMDALVSKNSKYPTWSEMVTAAGDFYFENQMKEIKFKNI